jgi:uncharacterized protein (TIGR04255 family)
MNLPKTITPCPIIDALLEVRFSTSLPPDAVFGIVYKELRKDYPKADSLPILQLPEPIRREDPVFRFKPHYKAVNDNFVVQIGPDIITISSFPIYWGWEMYSKEIFRVLGILRDLDIVESVLRLGYHVINYFPENIFSKTKISIQIDEREIDYKNTLFKTEISESNVDISTTLQISNDAQYKEEYGSIIDVDSFKDNIPQRFFTEMEAHINALHEVEKNTFFSLLREEFLSTLSPEY